MDWHGVPRRERSGSCQRRCAGRCRSQGKGRSVETAAGRPTRKKRPSVCRSAAARVPSKHRSRDGRLPLCFVKEQRCGDDLRSLLKIVHPSRDPRARAGACSAIRSTPPRARRPARSHAIGKRLSGRGRGRRPASSTSASAGTPRGVCSCSGAAVSTSVTGVARPSSRSASPRASGSNGVGRHSGGRCTARWRSRRSGSRS